MARCVWSNGDKYDSANYAVPVAARQLEFTMPYVEGESLPRHIERPVDLAAGFQTPKQQTEVQQRRATIPASLSLPGNMSGLDA
jgi:hypothetical protein